MKKLILFLIIILSATIVFAQETPPPSQYLKSVNGQFYMDTRDSSIWQYMGSPYGWQKKARFKDVLLYGDSKFASDLTVYLPPGYTFGKYANGSTIPATNKTAAEIIQDAIVVAIPPAYTAPAATISGSPSPGIWEIGTNLTLAFGSNYIQNDGGAATGTTYYKGAAALAGNTDAITLTSAVSYSVKKAYAQGTCKPNNLGTVDCTGQINAGTATSGVITYTPQPKLYTGTCTGTAPTATEILAASGGASPFTTSRAYNMTVTFAGSNLHVFYAYPTALGALTSAKDQAGNQVIGAYTITTMLLTNASGYVQNYYVATSNNTYSNTSIYTAFL